MCMMHLVRIAQRKFVRTTAIMDTCKQTIMVNCSGHCKHIVYAYFMFAIFVVVGSFYLFFHLVRAQLPHILGMDSDDGVHGAAHTAFIGTRRNEIECDKSARLPRSTFQMPQ